MTRTRRGAAAVAAALTALAVSACQPQTQPGAAAVIGNTEISNGQLLAAVDAALSDPRVAQAGRGAQLRAQIQNLELGRLVRTELLQRVAAREGVSVSAGEVDQRIQQITAQVGGEDQLAAAALQQGIPPSDIRASLRLGLLQEAIVAKIAPQATSAADARQALVSRVQQVASEVGVRVNPRFGQYDPQTGGVVERQFTVSSPAPGGGAARLG